MALIKLSMLHQLGAVSNQDKPVTFAITWYFTHFGVFENSKQNNICSSRTNIIDKLLILYERRKVLAMKKAYNCRSRNYCINLIYALNTLI